MKAADLFVKALESEGVERIFALPGEENLALLDALSRSSIRVILARHEQAAGFMAATCGRLTGKAGVCLATLGPGATNLVTAAAYAQLGAMPMVMVTGQKPVKTSKQGRFQILDVVDMMQPVTKSARQVASAERVPSDVREAFRLAEEDRAGAVLLELPEDVAEETTDREPIPASYSRRPVAADEAIERAAGLLASAARPVLLIGARANRPSAAEALRAFVDRQQIPFFTTQMGKGVVNEDHALFMGNAALSEDDFVHRAIEKADVVLNVGHDVVEKPPFFMGPDRPQTVIHLNGESAAVDPVYSPQFEVVGDIAASVRRLDAALTNPLNCESAEFLAVKRDIDAHLAEGSDADGFPLDPRRIVAEVRDVMPDDGIITLDNGLYKIWFARNYPARRPNTVLLDNALASMGAGLPSAMGARVVFPDRKIMAICGDGGFLMNVQDLETAVRLKMNLALLVLRDDAYGMIRWKQRDMGLEEFGLGFENPDFVALAESFGARGRRVGSADELPDVLREVTGSDGIHVVDVPIRYPANIGPE